MKAHEPQYYDYLMNRYHDKKDMAPQEVIYRIVNKVDEPPRCLICGQYIPFHRFSLGYQTYCSKECKYSSEGKKAIVKKSKETSLERYGIDNPAKTAQTKEKARLTCLDRYGVDNVAKTKEAKAKSKETCLKRYGTECSWSSDQVKEKIKATLVEKYGVDNPMKSREFQEKAKRTCIERYGADNILKSKETKEKIKETCLERYDVDNPWKSRKIREKCTDTLISNYGVDNPFKSKEIMKKVIWKEVSKKAFETKKRNGTCNTSKIEDAVYAWLHTQFTNVQRNYAKDPRYPWHCDFYIPSLDLFIEVQGSWTHGKHPFDKENKEDIKEVISLKEHAKTSKYYANALEVWTNADVMKRNKAKEEDLNYFEYFGTSLDDFKDQLEKFLN